MVNKVEGPGGVRGTQQVRQTAPTGRPTPASGTGFATQLDKTSGAHGVTGAGGVHGLTDVTAVLGVQEVDDALNRAARGKARANEILEKLEELRLQLLAGELSREKLVQLSCMIAQRRPAISDPRLSEILDEIDLRAQVELAKYTSESR